MVKRIILSLFIFVRATKKKGGRHNNTSLTIYILLAGLTLRLLIFFKKEGYYVTARKRFPSQTY